METGYPGCGCTDNDRDVTKISGCRVNTTSRRGIKQLGIPLVIFFYFPMRVTRGQVNSSQGKSLMPAMNDVKMEQHGKREVNDILYKENGHLTKDRHGISIFEEPHCDCEQQTFYYSCCPKFKSSGLPYLTNFLPIPV